MPGLISFTLDSTKYQAVEGMTWWEWINSDYSDGCPIISTYEGGPIHPTAEWGDDYDVTFLKGQSSDDVIVNNTTYTWISYD